MATRIGRTPLFNQGVPTELIRARIDKDGFGNALECIVDRFRKQAMAVSSDKLDSVSLAIGKIQTDVDLESL